MASTKTTIGNAKAQDLGPVPQEETSIEEREEELAERENALAERELRLVAMEARMQAALDRMERAATGKKSAEDLEEEPKILLDAQGREIPRLDLSMPHGTVIGDPDAGYVQNGHRFTKDRRYICEEPRGVGKPFNIAMLGLIKVVKAAA